MEKNKELLSLLYKMKTDETNAPGEYQNIIDRLPTKKLKNMLRINQKQEREHRIRVSRVIKEIEKTK